MEYAISLFMNMPYGAEDRKNTFGIIKKEILDEVEDPLKVLRQLRATEKLIKDILSDKDITDLILDEAEKYGKRFDHAGAYFEVRETGTKYDFSVCNDSVWEDIQHKVNEETEKRKEREKFLKALPDEGVPNPDTGEIINKPIRQSTTSVTVKL